MPRSSVVLAAVVLLAVAGAPESASAQVDLEGGWASLRHEDDPERGAGPAIGEYQGLPINDAARLRADSWTASLWTVPEHQCIPHPSDYGPNFSPVRIWKTLDPVTKAIVSWHTEIAWMNPQRTIWMDDRPHPPPYAQHTWQGFSTGRWDGDMLTVTTTHLKPGYVRRNGLPRSESGTLLEHFVRNGDTLTWISIVTDPVYLTEPYIKSRDFRYNPGYQLTLYPCSVDVEIDRPDGEIPHYLPGTNPFLTEFAEQHALPLEAVRGGSATTYPGQQPLPVPSVVDPARIAIESASPESGEVQILHAQGNVYMLVGSGGNSAVQVGDDGVLVVDTMTAAAADQFLAAIRTLSTRPILHVLNTHGHVDHTGGNAAVAQAGRYDANGENRPGGGASIWAYETVLSRMSAASSGDGRAAESGGWPTDTYFVDRKDLFVNGEPVRLLHHPGAHTDGDSVVLFRRSDVVSTGDLFTPDRYPVVDAEQGGSINGLLAGLNEILALTVPELNQEGGTLVIPGHGRLCDESDVAEYRDMVTIVRDRIQNLIDQDLTLEQVQAVRPTRDYDGVYASTASPGEMFVEAVYRSLRSASESSSREADARP